MSKWFGSKEVKAPSEVLRDDGDTPLPRIMLEIHLIPNSGQVRSVYGIILTNFLMSKLENSHLSSHGKTRWDFPEGRTRIIANLEGSYRGVVTAATMLDLRSKYPEYLKIIDDIPPAFGIDNLYANSGKEALFATSASQLPHSGASSSGASAPPPMEEAPQVPKLNVNFSELGIGGMDVQLNHIMIELLSRCVKDSARKMIDLTEHTKGILLYGPPGTGKTLIASKIAAILGVPEERFKVVHGPEVLNRFVGEAERSTRELFADAERDPRHLHVVFFDEFDAIARSRGGEGVGARVGDNIVNTILTKMDGAKKINNILVIAATNRLDIIDEALLRPGRFGTQLCIGLPDLQGRQDILHIHTRNIAKSVMTDIDLAALAALTKNYTGSELKQVCHGARLLALQDAAADPKDVTSIDESKIKITMDHFLQSIDKIKPHCGKHISKVELLPARGSAIPSQQELISVIASRILSFRPGQISSILITGETGCGKSSVAGLLMDRFRTHFDSIYVISPGITSHSLVEDLTQAWESSKPVQRTLVILDGLERGIELINENRFNEPAVRKLNTLMSSQTFKHSQHFVIVATMSSKAETYFQIMNPTAHWSARFTVEPLRPDDVAVLMQTHSVQCPDLGPILSCKPISKILDILYSGSPSNSHDEWAAHADLLTVDELM